jgi:hypothetical protein
LAVTCAGKTLKEEVKGQARIERRFFASKK